MRLSTAILIAITLVFSGLANAMTAEPPCPMSSTLEGPMDLRGEMMHMDMSEDHDCCNDLETYLKTGKLCKTSQPCSSPIAGLIPVIPAFSAYSFTSIFPAEQQPPPLSAHPIGVWRPPTFS